jgi:4-alpha-glucanotransferase
MLIDYAMTEVPRSQTGIGIALVSNPANRFRAGAAPSRLKLISPYDVIGEPRQLNLPGTVDEYPNWRLPLPEILEQLRADPRVAEITAAFRAPGARNSR